MRRWKWRRVAVWSAAFTARQLQLLHGVSRALRKDDQSGRVATAHQSGVHMFERFTDRARRVVGLAQEEATILNHNYIRTEPMRVGLIHEGELPPAKALESLG